MTHVADESNPDVNVQSGWALTHTDRSVYQDIKLRARTMRENPTPAEDRLWQLVRRKQIGGFHFRRQHPIGRFIVDSYCARARLVIEVDGSVHDQPGYDEYDSQRQTFLEDLGLHVLRFANEEVMGSMDFVLRRIREALHR